MRTKILDILDNVLIGILLVTSYLGFFFIFVLILSIAGVKLTWVAIGLAMVCGISATNTLLRITGNVQAKQREKKRISSDTNT